MLQGLRIPSLTILFISQMRTNKTFPGNVFGLPFCIPDICYVSISLSYFYLGSSNIQVLSFIAGCKQFHHEEQT